MASFSQISGASITSHFLADGDSGAQSSIEDMRALVDGGLKDPRVYTLARRIVQGVPAYDDAAEARALYDWVKARIRFVKGTAGKQSLQSPVATLALQAGQCTDFSTLLAALAMSIGYPARLVTVATDDAAPDQFTHIFPEIEINGAWVAADAAREDSAFGVPPPRVYRRQEFDILDETGNMPKLGDVSTTDNVLNTIASVAQTVPADIAAAQGPYLSVPGYGLVANPAYGVPVGAPPLLQASSQALGVPSLLLLGLGAWVLYMALKK